jgi:methionyl-tRNA synthetase
VATHSLRFPRLRSGQAVQAWAKSELPAGQALRQPAPLFKKLDEGVIEEEYARLER